MKGMTEQKMVEYSKQKAEALWIQWTALVTPKHVDVLLQLILRFSICLEDV